MTENVTHRDSNMELYRILAMVFVMLFHASGEIDLLNKNVDASPIESTNITWFTAATFTCVNMFVLLSGWYGIKARFEKLLSFLFQVLFFSFLVYFTTCALFDEVAFKWSYIARIVTTDMYWFVPVYLLLYIVSPALNTFITQSTRRQYQLVLGGMLLMQCIFGWLNTQDEGYKDGCSPISFIILYLLGGYLRRFPDNLLNRLSRTKLLLCYILLVSVNMVIAKMANIFNSEYLIEVAWRYASPLVIVAAACMLLVFTKTKMGYNRTINWIAASCFAVFLVHCFPTLYETIFRPTIVMIWKELPVWTAVPAILLFLTVIFFASIVIDQGRIWLYDKFFKELYN